MTKSVKNLGKAIKILERCRKEDRMPLESEILEVQMYIARAKES